MPQFGMMFHDKKIINLFTRPHLNATQTESNPNIQPIEISQVSKESSIINKSKDYHTRIQIDVSYCAPRQLTNYHGHKTTLGGKHTMHIR